MITEAVQVFLYFGAIFTFGPYVDILCILV